MIYAPITKLRPKFRTAGNNEYPRQTSEERFQQQTVTVQDREPTVSDMIRKVRMMQLNQANPEIQTTVNTEIPDAPVLDDAAVKRILDGGKKNMSPSSMLQTHTNRVS